MYATTSHLAFSSSAAFFGIIKCSCYHKIDHRAKGSGGGKRGVMSYLFHDIMQAREDQMSARIPVGPKGRGELFRCCWYDS